MRWPLNPKPSLYQAMVLHEIDLDRVFRRDGDWWLTGSYREHKVTPQVQKLEKQGYIFLSLNGSTIQVTKSGQDVLARRPLGDLLDQLNRR